MEYTYRQQEILEYLKPRRFASVTELSHVIFMSEATVRRDIQKLEEKGILKSVYGGVVISEYANDVVPVALRDGENADKKEKIALEAASLIQDNDTVIFDSSSTVRRICRHIKNRKNLTIITNNLRVCQEFKDSDVHLYCTGGALIPRRECFVGPMTERFINEIRADKLFFSAQGLSADGTVTDSSEEEISLRKVMFTRSREHYFLCDSSKFNREFSFQLCTLSDITRVIVDIPMTKPEG
ncbi:MAG: DeoR/GlpR transcriptional regulator [Ruminococcaceae bacterium]|nr:DeoR/GlpR transcriptional regulator [Oscillospiraceae bacterium]